MRVQAQEAWREARDEWLSAGEHWREEANRLEQRRTPGERCVCLVGQGAYLGVANGALTLASGRSHGAPGDREVLHKALHDVGLIVALTTTGTLSLAALDWCRAEGITVLLVTPDGHLSAATVGAEARADAVHLKRAQFAAATSGADVLIARHLLLQKLHAQRQVLDQYAAMLPGASQARETFDMAHAWLALDTPTPLLATLDGVRTFEARCARAYWGAWIGLPLAWATAADVRRVPPHWRTIRERGSPLAPNDNGRHAVDPANALLNYAYSLLEGQCRAALTREGFDLAVGFAHADHAGRDSLVYDAMEPLRGVVDARVLAFLGARRLAAGDCTRTADGGCRLHPQLARAVIAACRLPQRRADDVARELRCLLLKEAHR